MILIKAIIVIIGIYLSLHVSYSLFLVLANFLIKEDETPFKTPKTRFVVLIPAHNEELLLPRLLKSSSGQNYPRGLFRTCVIADNCTDNTAGVAAANGAIVLERTDPERRGKGYAIKWALEEIKAQGHDAVFIVDADSVMDKNVLKELDRNLCSGREIIQCYNGIENPDDSWFTRLLEVSRAISNFIYHPAKQKLGLSSSLMGNGMCFSRKALSKHGWDAFSVGEDWEYYAKLMHRGEIVAYNMNARVYHRESSTLKQATSQRMRWSSGRFAVAWNYGLGLLFKGMAGLDMKKADASLPLILPNPSLGINLSVAMFLASAILYVKLNDASFILWFSALIALQASVFMIGIFYTEHRLKNFLSIFIAPLFLIWKMGIDILSFLGLGRKNWVRTGRRL